jgi:hypothetical protein
VTGTALVFAVLVFNYQWRDARFTTYFFGLLVIAAVAVVAVPCRGTRGEHARYAAVSASVICLILTSLLYAPKSYWQPEVAGIRFGPKDTWLAQARDARAVDRFGLGSACHDPGRFCQEVPLIATPSYHVQRIMNDYRSLMLGPP